MLQGICLGLEGASTYTSDRRRTEGQRHYPVRVAVTTLDLGEIRKEVTTSLLRAIVLFVGERSVGDRDQSDLIPFEMSTWKTKSHLTLVSKLCNCVRVT